ncbi:MAG: hypothetical protein WC479_04595 [Candidatus Izemoplasmatales bacterium]
MTTEVGVRLKAFTGNKMNMWRALVIAAKLRFHDPYVVGTTAVCKQCGKTLNLDENWILMATDLISRDCKETTNPLAHWRDSND